MATVVVFTDQSLFVVEVVDGGAGFGQFFFCPFAHGVVAVAGDGVAVFSDFDQAFTAVVEVLPVRLCAGGVDGDVVIGVAFAPFDQVAVGAAGVADMPLAGDQYGSEPVGFVYPVFVADVFRAGCAVLVWESSMHSHGNHGNEVI